MIPDGFELDINTDKNITYDGDVYYKSEAYLKANSLEIKFGEAIAQIVPIKLQNMEIKEVSNEEIENAFKERNRTRGKDGFRSTGA